jgi:AcrR family transcriptional regulator
MLKQAASDDLRYETVEALMRYAPGHNKETRERIVGAASRLFREHGIAAVGLAKVMAEADLTVGTFYTHFKSKEVLCVRDRGKSSSASRVSIGAAGNEGQPCRRGGFSRAVGRHAAARTRDSGPRRI